MKKIPQLIICLTSFILPLEVNALSVFLGAQQLSVSEADKVVYIPVRRSEKSNRPTKVKFITSSSTAKAGKDFKNASGVIVIPAGADKAMIKVKIKNDKRSEKTEHFILSIISANNASLSVPRTTQIDILDDEKPVTEVKQPGLISIYTMETENAVTGMSFPIAIQFNPLNPDIAYVAEKGGVVYSVSMKTGKKIVFMDISERVNNSADRGLMNIAVHPDFSNYPYLYAFYVVDPPDIRNLSDSPGNRYAYISRFEADASQGYRKVIKSSEVILVGGAGKSAKDISGKGKLRYDIIKYANEPASDYNKKSKKYKQDYIKVDSTTHVGGGLGFAPDGSLYASIGDGVAFNFVDPRAVSVQKVDALAGKVIRINPLTGEGYRNNPYATSNLKANRSKVYQMGLRNPFRLAFDDNGKLFISETGWHTYEEINSGKKGANYGWPFFEGGDNGVNLKTDGFKQLSAAKKFYKKVSRGAIRVTPAYRAFAHDNNIPGFQVQAITGSSVVYTGTKYAPEFNGDYFFSDFPGNEIYSVDSNDRQKINFVGSAKEETGPVDFQQGPDGLLYYVDIASGNIVRILDIVKTGGVNIHATRAYEALQGSVGNDVFVFAKGTSVPDSIDLLVSWNPGDIIDISALAIKESELTIREIGRDIIKLVEGSSSGDFQLKVKLNGYSKDQILKSVQYDRPGKNNTENINKGSGDQKGPPDSSDSIINTVKATNNIEKLYGSSLKDIFVFADNSSIVGKIDTIYNWVPGDLIDLTNTGVEKADIQIIKLSDQLIKLTAGATAGSFQLKVGLNGFSQDQITSSIQYGSGLSGGILSNSNEIRATNKIEKLIGTTKNDTFIFTQGTTVVGAIDLIENWKPGDSINLEALGFTRDELSVKQLANDILKVSKGYSTGDFQLKIEMNNYSQAKILNSFIYSSIPSVSNSKIYATTALDKLTGTLQKDAFVFKKNTSVAGKVDTVFKWAPGDEIDLSALNLVSGDLEFIVLSGGFLKLTEGWSAGDFQLKIEKNNYSTDQITRSIIY